MATTTRRRRFSPEEYLRMASAGVFGEDERVELIEGEVLQMSPQGDDHVDVVRALTGLLVLAYAPAGYLVSPQTTFRAGAASMPEPDLAVLPADTRGVVDVARAILLVEVADSSLALDRTRKARLYATAGAPCYWIVEIPARRVRVLTEPSGGAYRTERLAGPGDRLALPALNATIAAREALPADPPG